MKIGIVGVGFVGGATAEVLKEVHTLYLYDKYKSPYNDLDNLKLLAKESEVVFISVPTPMQPSGAIDYKNVYSSVGDLLAATKIAGRNPQDILVIIRSTAVSGTTDKLAEQYPFRFAFNPEFLREKHAIEDMQNTDRVVLGANDQISLEQAADVYKPVFPNARFILTSTKTAEMIKYMANGMLTGQVALANEFYQICKAVGIDYDSVKQAVLLDPRIGRNLDVPGPDRDLGFGGKCFPKDLNAIIYLARENGHRANLLEEVWRINERVRKNKDWLDITGATSGNNFEEPAK
jgi:UDPglucose 6-dehydrogenase